MFSCSQNLISDGRETGSSFQEEEKLEEENYLNLLQRRRSSSVNNLATRYNPSILHSLQSPLVNEQDLAISVCSLMSAPIRRLSSPGLSSSEEMKTKLIPALKLTESPAILEGLLAHAGIFRDCGMRLLLEEINLEAGRGLDYTKFWNEVVAQIDDENAAVRQLICECFGRKEVEDPSLGCGVACFCSRTGGDEGMLRSLPFTLARSQMSSDGVGQRVRQIADILRNLSFEKENARIFAKSETLMRFLLVTAYSNYDSLMQAAYDTIGNISSFYWLQEEEFFRSDDPSISLMVLDLVTSSIFSEDRFKILRSLEALGGLAMVEGNVDVLCRYVEDRVYRRLCDLLTLHDVMLLIYTLECLLAVTGLGEAVSEEIARVPGAVSTLISLVTFEARSLGSEGCILLKIVEYPGGDASSVEPQQTSCPTTDSSEDDCSSGAVSPELDSSPSVTTTRSKPVPEVRPEIFMPISKRTTKQKKTKGMIASAPAKRRKINFSKAAGCLTLSKKAKLDEKLAEDSSAKVNGAGGHLDVVEAISCSNHGKDKLRVSVTSNFSDASSDLASEKLHINSKGGPLVKNDLIMIATDRGIRISASGNELIDKIAGTNNSSTGFVQGQESRRFIPHQKFPPMLEGVLGREQLLDLNRRRLSRAFFAAIPRLNSITFDGCSTWSASPIKKKAIGSIQGVTINSPKVVIIPSIPVTGSQSAASMSALDVRTLLVSSPQNGGLLVPIENDTMPNKTVLLPRDSEIQLQPHRPNVVAPKSELCYLCEWAGCELGFRKPEQVRYHALREHCPESLDEAVKCKWGQYGCDSLSRKRFSLMTHLQDRHCSNKELEHALIRRVHKIDSPRMSQLGKESGHSPNAAFHVIQRHAAVDASREDEGEPEGPVTVSIRLTAALILQNLVQHSEVGRRTVQVYESHLATIAMSNLESSRTVAQILYEINESKDEQILD